MLIIKSGNTDLSEAFDLSKADVQGDPNELLMEAFEKIAGNLILIGRFSSRRVCSARRRSALRRADDLCRT